MLGLEYKAPPSEPWTAGSLVGRRDCRVRLGANCRSGKKCDFLVWAPNAKRVELRLLDSEDRFIEMRHLERGYYHVLANGVEPGSLYFYRLDGQEEFPDPASQYQPKGVHGPTQVVNRRDFSWTDGNWIGPVLADYIFYEVHVGTYTPAGTFAALIEHLDDIRSLGITALELMPVAQFPGTRNWGYDGVSPFAVQDTYGGPAGLKRLVNACHERGIAVTLDVVYNHLGPEGNYLKKFGPYFTDHYQTPWGSAINFDGPESDEVVRYFLENALYWLDEFHADALRLDAIHGIVDRNAQSFLELLAETVHEFAQQRNRKAYLIAETDLNDARFVSPRQCGGYGLDAQWNDDFHHALHTLQTGERSGYYRDFGGIAHLAKAFSEGYVYSGQYSEFRRRRHGNSSSTIAASQFVVFSQNHDQVGNRMLGERSSQLLSFEALKLSAGAVLLSPFLPLLFMGEEYGEKAPFLYFTSHSDPILEEAVRRGRKAEFAGFDWNNESLDPQAESTFLASKLDHTLLATEPHRQLREFYKELIRLRKANLALRHLSKDHCEVEIFDREKCLFLRRWYECDEVFAVFNFGDDTATIKLRVPKGNWRRLLDSAQIEWSGTSSRIPSTIRAGTPVILHLEARSFCLFNQSFQR